MASSDVDQKYIGRLADLTQDSNPVVSVALYQILGLSVVLSRKLYRARKLRRLDTTRDTRSLQLYHHIIWLSKEGLAILEAFVLPYTQDGQEGSECQVLAAKLRASFLHIFCIFHNDPPITAASGSSQYVAESGDTSTSTGGQTIDLLAGTGLAGASSQKETTPPKRNSRGRQPALRDPINSVTSDASFLTNPYAGMQPGESPPMEDIGPSFPPGLERYSSLPHPSAFLLPARNFVPIAKSYFTTATSAAAVLLPGAHPLRLSTALEHAAFLWDCVHDHEGARQLSRRTIRHLKDREEEEVSDEAFEDAAEMVQILGKLMKRKSVETTPRTGRTGSAGSGAVSSVASPLARTSQPEPAQPRLAQDTARRSNEPNQGPPPGSGQAQGAQRQTPPRPPRPEAKDLPDTPTRIIGGRPRADSNRSAKLSATRPVGATAELTPPRMASNAGARRTAEASAIGDATAAAADRRGHRQSASISHGRQASIQASPLQLQTLPKSPSRPSSKRRMQSVEEPSQAYIYPATAITPPRLVPRYSSYSPSTRSSGRSSGSSRRGSSAGRRVDFETDPQTGKVMRRYDDSEQAHNTFPSEYSSDDGAHDSALGAESRRRRRQPAQP